MKASPMTEPKVTKHELRTRETRELLLRAAEQIFVRDGYEQAELGEIAALAGRTKGAIYGHFKSKEDIFLALVESHAQRNRAAMQKLLEDSSSIAGNVAAFRKFFVESVRDETWGLLLLEFRLYTIRHPDARERLRAAYETIIPKNEESAYAALLGAAGKDKKAVSRAAAVHGGFAMLSALQLEARYSPGVFGRGAIDAMAARLFDALFDPK
jgi:AcrR family transcriptional regulator